MASIFYIYYISSIYQNEIYSPIVRKHKDPFVVFYLFIIIFFLL